MKKTLSLALLGAMAFGFLAIGTSEPAHAGKGGKGKPPPSEPPACGCAVVIATEEITCVLDDCAEFLPGVYECLYTCTFN
jgi:hypothetical protein